MSVVGAKGLVVQSNMWQDKPESVVTQLKVAIFILGNHCIIKLLLSPMWSVYLFRQINLAFFVASTGNLCIVFLALFLFDYFCISFILYPSQP